VACLRGSILSSYGIPRIMDSIEYFTKKRELNDQFIKKSEKLCKNYTASLVLLIVFQNECKRLDDEFTKGNTHEPRSI